MAGIFYLRYTKNVSVDAVSAGTKESFVLDGVSANNVFSSVFDFPVPCFAAKFFKFYKRTLFILQLSVSL